MKKKTPVTIVIFGATGNLYADKLAKALYLLFLEGKLPNDFNIISFARRDLSDRDFRISTKESILKRGEIDISKLESFLEHITYFKGDFSEKNDFARLKDSIPSDAQVLLHIATASEMYEKIFENIATSGLNRVNQDVKILIEKPFGKDEADAKRLETVLSKIFKEDQIFHVDHYLAKETAKTIYDFQFNAKPARNAFSTAGAGGEIEKIKVVFHESNIVGSRGAYYDAVGAFRDVGQNHMLQLLALAIMNKPTENIRAARLKALNDLSIADDPKIVRGQYEDYCTGSNIAPNSQTETFFRVFLKILSTKNPNFSDIVFELEGGKGLADSGSNITTTVAVEIYPKNQTSEKGREKIELKIQPVEGTVYESYTTVYNDALRGDQTNFPSIEEILAEWRITDEILSKWKNTPLVIYKKGTKAEDIK